jgi:hypothetical protein
MLVPSAKTRTNVMTKSCELVGWSDCSLNQMPVPAIGPAVSAYSTHKSGSGVNSLAYRTSKPMLPPASVPNMRCPATPTTLHVGQH